MGITSRCEKREDLPRDAPIALEFHKVTDVRFIDIDQKNDRAECSLSSVITILEEGFLGDRMRGRRTQFHLKRKDCSSAWNIKELRQDPNPFSGQALSKVTCHGKN